MLSKESSSVKSVGVQSPKSVFLHAKIYRRHNSKENEDYDGLLLTEKDCKKIVKDFYENKNSVHGSPIYANMGHDLGKATARIATTNDIYFNPKDGCLNAFLQIFSFQPGFEDLLKKLEKKATNVGVSVELEYMYEFTDPKTGTKTIFNPNIKSDAEKLHSLDKTCIRVSGKKLTGIGIVDVPNHAEDGTFVTSWCKEDQRELANSDVNLKQFLESLPKNDPLRENYYKQEVTKESTNSMEIDNKQINNASENIKKNESTTFGATESISHKNGIILFLRHN